MRKIGEVKFPDKVWLKRYLDSKRWNMIRESQVVSELKHLFPDDWEHQMENMRKGMGSILSRSAEYMWLEESCYHDELDLTYYMTTKEWNDYHSIRDGIINR